MTADHRSGDISWYNGTSPDISGFENIFVCTIRCNQGGIERTTYADQQTAYVAARLGFSSQYVFNGNVDAYSAGVLFGQQGLPGFVPGMSGILVDCEDEGATGTHAWGPTEALAFISGVQSVRPDIPTSAFFIYHNYTVNRRFDWSACVAAGCGLVYARPGGPDDYQWWPTPYDRYIKQDGTVQGIDADWHSTPWSQIIGTTLEEDEMPTIVTIDDWNGQTYLVVPGRYIIYITEPHPHLDAAGLIASKSVHTDSAHAQALLDECAMGNYTADDLKTLPSTPAKILPCTALNPAPTVTVTDAQVQQLGTQLGATLSAGASPSQVETAVKTVLDALTLKAA